MRCLNATAPPLQATAKKSQAAARTSILKRKQKEGAGTASTAAIPTAQPSAKAAWSVAADEGGDEELIDDEELLTEADKQRPAPGELH